MSDLSTAASLLRILRGLPTIIFGIKLMRKDNRTEEEAKAAKSFKRFLISTIIVVLVSLTAVGASVVVVFSSNDGKLYDVKRYGTVEGDSVWYIKNTKQYLLLEEFGLDKYNLQDGDRVILFFNSPDDELIDAMPQKIYDDNANKGLSVMLITMVAAVVVMVLFAVVGRKTVGKDFHEFYRLCRMGERTLQQ